MHTTLQNTPTSLKTMTPAADETASKTTDAINRLETRIRGLEAAYKRPYIPTSLNQPVGSHMKVKASTNHALSEYMRLGDAGSYKSLASADPRTGSILLPSITQDFVDQAVPDYSPLRKLARVSQIATDSLELLVDKGSGDVGWVSEVDKREETKAPELVRVTIPTFEMYARPRASQKLLDDIKVDLEQWLVSKIAWQMGMMENQAFITGDGRGKPKGFLNYPLVDAGKGAWGKIESLKTGKDAALVDGDCLVDLFHTMQPEYLEGAVWMMPRSVLALVRKLKDKQGAFLYSEGMIAGQPATLLGHPIVISDAMPALIKGAASVVFANLRYSYQIVERQDVQLLRDPYSAKPYVEFYATKRIGGDVVNFDAIKALRFE